MQFCENIYCDQADEPMERMSDYRIVDGAVICVDCYEIEQDSQEELAANQPDYDYELGHTTLVVGQPTKKEGRNG